MCLSETVLSHFLAPHGIDTYHLMLNVKGEQTPLYVTTSYATASAPMVSVIAPKRETDGGDD